MTLPTPANVANRPGPPKDTPSCSQTSQLASDLTALTLPCARESTERARSSSNPPSIERLTRLIQANYCDYGCRVLRKEVLGVQRVVLVLGESHIKSPQAAKVGRDIIESFEHRGLEGVNLNKFQKLLTSATYWLGRHLMRAKVGSEGISQGSTIDEADAGRQLDAIKDELAVSLAKTARDKKYDLSNLESIPEHATIPFRGHEIPLQKFDEATIRFGDSALSGQLVIEAAHEILQAGLRGEAAQVIEKHLKSGPKTYPLEEGYQPGWKETIGLATPFILIGALACSIAPDLPVGTWLGNPVVKSLLAAICVSNLIQHMLPRRFEDYWWFSYLGGPSALIGKPRDPIMARNIDKVLESNKEIESMIAVVGSHHLPGISHEMQKNGWSEEHIVRRAHRSRWI